MTRLDRYGDPIDDQEAEPDASQLDLNQLDHGKSDCDGRVIVRVGATCAVLTCRRCHRLAVIPLQPSAQTRDHTPNNYDRED